jgi:hypothetical protein
MSKNISQSNQHVAIYELLNDTLREVYVGFTDQPLEAFAVHIMGHRPKVLKHWRDAHRIVFRCVEPKIPAADASSFVSRYVGAIAAKKMKVLWQDMLWLD